MIIRCFGFLLLNFCAFINSANAVDFSWKNLLSRDAEFVTASISSFATCSAAIPLYTKIPVITEKTIAQRDFLRPLNGTLIELKQDPVPVFDTAIMTCKVKQDAEIQIIFWKQKALLVKIEYASCEKRSLKSFCEINTLIENQYDKELFSTLDKPYVYSFLSGYKNDKDKNFKKYMLFYKDSDLERLLFDGECDTRWDTRESIFTACIIDASVDNDVFHSLSMIEVIEKGWFRDKILAHFASKQLFVSITAYRSALDAVELQFNNVLATYNDSLRKPNDIAEHERKAINSALGHKQ